MTDENTVILMGNLVRDINVSNLPTGTVKGDLTIAVNRSRKNGDQWVDEVSYFDITGFGNLINNLQNYLKKGQKVLVHGYLKQDRWEKDGQKHSKVGIVAEKIQLCGGKQNANNSGAKTMIPAQIQNFADTFGGEVIEGGEDIPF